MQRKIFDPIQSTVLQLAAEQVARPGAILDVGCGTGKLLGLARARFPDARLVGVDAAIEMVKQARVSHPTGGIEFQQAMAEELPFPDASFDLAFSTMTFHHWRDQNKGAAEIARVLTPEGRWLLAEFVPTGFMKYVRKLLRLTQFPERSGLQATLSTAGLKAVAEQAAPGLRGQVTVFAIATTRA